MLSKRKHIFDDNVILIDLVIVKILMKLNVLPYNF